MKLFTFVIKIFVFLPLTIKLWFPLSATCCYWALSPEKKDYKLTYCNIIIIHFCSPTPGYYFKRPYQMHTILWLDCGHSQLWESLIPLWCMKSKISHFESYLRWLFESPSNACSLVGVRWCNSQEIILAFNSLSELQNSAFRLFSLVFGLYALLCFSGTYNLEISGFQLRINTKTKQPDNF